MSTRAAVNRVASSNKEHLKEVMREYGIPLYMRDSLVQYILVGRPVGDFLTAIINNDLKGAVNRADDENQKLIVQYVKFLYNNAPNGCWGSFDSTKHWIERGGLYPSMREELS
jgi:hypothetical protein